MTAWSVSSDRALEVSVEVELTDRVTGAVRLLPEVHVDAVLIAHTAGGRPHAGDAAAAERLRADPEAAAVLAAFAAATHAVEAAGSGRIWVVEGALRALQLIELLALPADEGSERGVWPAWETLAGEAALALAEIPEGARVAGGGALRLAALSAARRIAPRSDRVTAERLRLVVETWPIPPEDQPDPDDSTMADLETLLATDRAAAESVHRSPAFRSRTGARRSRLPGAAVTVEADLAPLVQAGLTYVGANVLATPQGGPGDYAWELRIPVHKDVARAYQELMAQWRPWRDETSGRAVEPTESVRSGFICRYGRLLVATHLPFSLDEFLAGLALVEPAPPHLADVVCTIESGERTARVGFLEELHGVGASATLDLVAVVPSELPPATGFISIALQIDRTPFVTGRRRTIVNRLLTLRRDLVIAGPKAARLTRSLRKLEDGLGDPALVDALRAEVAAFARGAQPWTDPDVDRLIKGLRRAETALAADLAAAVDGEDVAQIQVLCAQLSRTRAYLVGVSD